MKFTGTQILFLHKRSKRRSESKELFTGNVKYARTSCFYFRTSTTFS